MLTPLEFAERVLLLQEELGFSVSSWVRTEKHNFSVGGVKLSAHKRALAADVLPDEMPEDQRPLWLGDLQLRANHYDLEVIDEWATKGHYHLQVKGWASVAW